MSEKLITVLSLSSISSSDRLTMIVFELSLFMSFIIQLSTRSSLVLGIIRSSLSDTSYPFLASFLSWSFSSESLKIECSNLGMSIGLHSIGLNVSISWGSLYASMTLKFKSSRLLILLNKKFKLLPSPSRFSIAMMASLWESKTFLVWISFFIVCCCLKYLLSWRVCKIWKQTKHEAM